MCLGGLQSLTWMQWLWAAFTGLGQTFCFFVPGLTNTGHQVAITPRQFVTVRKISEACNVKECLFFFFFLFQSSVSTSTFELNSLHITVHKFLTRGA